MSEYFIQVPPDSTGKAIRHSIQLEIDYINPINPGAETFTKGEIVTFATSGMIGTVALDHFAGGVQHTEPHVHLLLTHGSPESIVVGEDMVVDGVVRADATVITQAFYIPVMQLTGGDNPSHSQKIDERGSASVRFTEGSPTFDAFGRMQAASLTTICEHAFNYNGRDTHFTGDTVSSGSIAHNTTTGGVVFTVDTGATDSCVRTTDIFNKYIPGQSQLIEMTIAIGDTGKANVMRRWGYFSETDGVFFELDGTELYTVIRSSTSGSVVNTRTLQADWSADKVNGNGGAFNVSDVDLDVSKDNIYWIDLQWLGAGKVRFGINVNGRRIICDESNNANQYDVSYMRTGSLPVRIELYNTAVSASISQMTSFCMTVKTEGLFEPHMGQFSYASPGEGDITNVLTPMFSLRPRPTHYTRTNRCMILPAFMSVSSHNKTNSLVPERVVVEVYKNAILTGATFAETVDASSATEIDITASGISGGRLVGSLVVDGVDARTIREFFDYMHENLVNKADGSPQTYTFAARTIRSTETASVMGTITWKEIRD